jgi:hypothetical protein
MRRFLQLSVIGLAVGVVGGCDSPEKEITAPDIPTAGVRFINAVPDTGAMDLRFVDIVESNAHWNIAFRNNPTTTAGVTSSTMVQYKNTQAGARHLRVFMSGVTPSVASTVVKDTTVTFEAGKLYTLIMWGNARPGGLPLQFRVLEENAADPGSNVALRVLNTTGTAIDVRQYAQGSAVPASATWAAVAARSLSAYVTAPPGNKMFNVQPAGGGSTLFADALALQGAAKTVDIEALPGTAIAGSAVTAIVFPRSVAGSAAPQAAAFQVPAVSFIWDRRPPR